MKSKVWVYLWTVIFMSIAIACVSVDWSAEFCKNNGGEFVNRAFEGDLVKSYCLFDDDTECESWAFYEGRCQPERVTNTPGPTPTLFITAAPTLPTTADDALNVAQQLADTPLDCPLGDDATFDYLEGYGYQTPQQALDAYLDEHPEIEHPPGEIAVKLEEAERVVWVYVREGEKVGSISAHYEPWGLWVVSSVERCVDESELPPVAPTRG